MFALVDCNSFYVSCERVFQPCLENKPVLVLSSNDGCVVSMSGEVKSLGVHIGQPLFQISDLVKKHKIHLFSANFALYGDMSARVMSLLQKHCDNMDIYSIDEAFLEVSAVAAENLVPFADSLIQEIKQATGIPISIGIGPTKTLAKMANYIAKKAGEKTQWVYALTHDTRLALALSQTEIGAIWGIGREWAAQLKAHHIHTAADLVATNLPWLRKRFGVILERIARELQGQSCLEMGEARLRQQIIVSRTFGQIQTEYHHVRSALTHFVSRAAQKLRDEQLVCRGINVFVKIKPPQGYARYYDSQDVQLPEATNHTTVLLNYALRNLQQLFIMGAQYKKVGVQLYNLSPMSSQQFSLFLPRHERLRGSQLMGVLDNINQKFGSNMLHYGCADTMQKWAAKRSMCSRAYTTSWAELLVVKAN